MTKKKSFFAMTTGSKVYETFVLVTDIAAKYAAVTANFITLLVRKSLPFSRTREFLLRGRIYTVDLLVQTSSEIYSSLKETCYRAKLLQLILPKRQ
jgi:hypothetical protein